MSLSSSYNDEDDVDDELSDSYSVPSNLGRETHYLSSFEFLDDDDMEDDDEENRYYALG